MQAGASEDKVREVTSAEKSAHYTESERAAIAYAEAMTITGERVTDALFARVRACFDEAQVVDTIARTDYDQPIATQRRTAAPPAPALPREGGFFRRFMEGFREP